MVAWYCGVEPTLPPVTERHDTVMVGGISIGSWCPLIAVTEQLNILA